MSFYHFSIGDSTNGPIGLCAMVEAENREQAVERLITRIGDECTVESQDEGPGEYVRVFFNSEFITEKDIDEEEA